MDPPLSLSFFLMLAIYGVVAPYLQLILRGLGYGPAAIGLLLGLAEAVGIAGPVLIARAVDMAGNYRGSLVLCGFFTAASMIPLVLLRGFAITALSLIVFTLGMKSMTPIFETALMALIDRSEYNRIHPDPQRAPIRGMLWGYGPIRAMGSAGFVVIAVALQLIPGIDGSPPWVFAMLIAATTLLFVLSLVALPEFGSLHHPQDRQAKTRAGSIHLNGIFLLGLAVMGLNRLGMSSIASFFSLYIIEDLKWNAVSGLWALSAALEIPLLIVSGKLIHRYGAMRVMAISSVTIGARLLVYALFPTPAGAVVGQLMHATCYGLYQPAAVAFVVAHYPKESRATGLSLYMGLSIGLPFFIGSALGGAIVELAGYRLLFAFFALFAFASVILYRAKSKVLD
jgi:PPP family 3-phenylpropionic acid transporter